MRSISVLALGLAVLGGTACGSDATDTEPGNPSGGTGGAGNDGDGGDGGAHADNDGDGGATADECGSAEKIAECKTRAADEGTCAEVGDCACDNCVCELGACEADAGCTDIRACAQEKGCLGIACYAPTTCQGVIDDNGGPTGPSTSLATAP